MKIQSTAVQEGSSSHAISVSGLSSKHSFPTYAGILPMTLKEGARGVILPDIHAPAHLKRVMWPLYQFLSDFRPELLVSIGDLYDIFGLARYPKALRAIVNPQWEIDTTRRLSDELMEAAGAERFVIIPGNHEDRLYRFLQDNCPQLGGLIDPHTREPLSIHSLAGYTANDPVTFIYSTEERGGFEGGLFLNNDIVLHHGILVRSKPGASPLADMDRYMQSVAHGHTHRMGMAAREVTASDEMITGVLRGYELGMLVDMDHSYMAYARQMWPNWHPGFAIFVVHNGVIHIQQIPISPVQDARGHERLTFTWEDEVYTESTR